MLHGLAFSRKKLQLVPGYASVLSYETRSRDTRDLRRRFPFLVVGGHVDVTPAHTAGGFDSDIESTSLEVRIPCGFLQHVSNELPVRPAHSGLEARHMIEDERLMHLLLAIDAEQRTGAAGTKAVSTKTRSNPFELLGEKPVWPTLRK